MKKLAAVVIASALLSACAQPPYARIASDYDQKMAEAKNMMPSLPRRLEISILKQPMSVKSQRTIKSWFRKQSRMP